MYLITIKYIKENFCIHYILQCKLYNWKNVFKYLRSQSLVQKLQNNLTILHQPSN